MYKTVYPMKKQREPKKPVTLVGKWRAELFDSHGVKKDEKNGFNVITSAGVEALASLLNDAAATATTNTFQYLAIGTDATSESNSDTALGVESSRITGTVSYVTGGIYQVFGTFAAGSGTGAIVEYGLFNSNSAGTMLSRDTESVINKGASDSLKVTCQITFAPG